MSAPASLHVASGIRKDNIPVAFNKLSVKEIESGIASIDANQIKGIATSLIANVMDRLWIDIRVTDIPRHIVQQSPSDIGMGTTWATAKIYDPNSILMKTLLPSFIERLTKSFSIPSDFMQNGIVFDFVNVDKNGLLDQVKDETLQKKVSEGLRGCSTYYTTLKAEAGKTLQLKFEQYKDGQWVSGQTASINYLVSSATECVI